jgi:hypothetical protein
MDDLIDCEESCEDEPVFSTEENKKLKKKIVELKKGIATAEYVAGLRDSPPQEGAEEDECKRGTSRRT